MKIKFTQEDMLKAMGLTIGCEVVWLKNYRMRVIWKEGDGVLFSGLLGSYRPSELIDEELEVVKGPMQVQEEHDELVRQLSQPTK